MSYILDALRRADAERERGAVPGLHAQPALPLPADGARRVPFKPWMWAALGGSVPLLVLALWWWRAADTAAPPNRPIAAAPALAPPTATPLPSAVPSTAAPTALPPSTVRPPLPNAPWPAAVTALPAPSPAAAPRRAAKPAERPGSAAPVPNAPKPRDPTRSARNSALPSAPDTEPGGAANGARATPSADERAVSSSADSRPVPLAELPAELRRRLPGLAVGGSVYSSQPASRLLILNGQAFHEGDTLAPGLTLELIQLKSAVLRFDGRRFTIAY